jgi:hypothetical protein
MHFIALFMSGDLFAQPRITYIDSIIIAAFLLTAVRVYQTLRPRDEEGRKAQKKARKTALLTGACLLLYALGRIILIVSNGATMAGGV